MRNLIKQTASLWRNTVGCLRKVDSKDLIGEKSTFFVDRSLRIKLSILLRDLRLVMEGSSSLLHPSLSPPSCVHGMTDLQKEKFVKRVKVPGIKLPKNQINTTKKTWKPFLLKLKGVSSIGELAKDDPLKDTHNLVLLDPAKVEPEVLTDDRKEILSDIGFVPTEKYELELGYENWSVSDILKSILPKESEGVSSFTQVGHIAHLNLKPENMPFKNVIGEVILDKIGSVKTVVNKLNTIDNTYRNFEMELLAGENNFVTQTKENGLIFELDFAKVYWNSRLSTEHQRIVDKIQQGSTVYDVFAGVGPFAIPLGKKKGCKVLANDLNPHSFKSLERNVFLNKIKPGHVSTYNLDGREFIKTVVKSDLMKRLGDAMLDDSSETDQKQNGIGFSDSSVKDNVMKSSVLNPKVINRKFYAVMNLPALAIDFLDCFDSLLNDIPEHLQNSEALDHVLPVVFCYAFCSKSGNIDEEVKERAQGVIKQHLPSDATVRFVRNVSPNKDMICLSFKLWQDLVLGKSIQGKVSEHDSSDTLQEEEPKTKKLKLIP